MTPIRRVEPGFNFDRVYYTSGPMAGYPENNFPAFQEAFDLLTDAGILVKSPHHVEHPGLSGQDHEWSEYLTNDLVVMLEQCNGIILLPGWAQSKGAMLELHVAMSLGWPVWFFDPKLASLTNMNRRVAA